MGSLVVISPEPFSCLVQCLLDRFENVVAEPFTPNRVVLALAIGVMLKLSELDSFLKNTLLFGPFYELAADIFRPIACGE